MFRIDHATNTNSLPTPEAVGTQGYFTEGDPSESIPATVVTADWANAVQEEIVGVIEGAGLTLDKEDSGQLLEAITTLIEDGAINDALVFKGVINCSANPNYPAADAGDTYKVSVAGKIGGGSGPNVEVGDILLCTVDSTSSGTHGSVGANWTIQQVNIDGAVTGPASSTSGNVPTFNGTSGKIIQDSGKAFSTDGTFAADSDAKVPTEKAVKTYVDNAVSTQERIEYVYESTTWLIPDGITEITLDGSGAGGGGGNASSGGGTGGSGGGGGEYLDSQVVDVTGLKYIDITIGNGGTAGNAGGDSIFGSLYTLKGGGAGASSGGAAGAGGTGGSGAGRIAGAAGGVGGPGSGNAGGGSGGGGGGGAGANSPNNSGVAGGQGIYGDGGDAPAVTANGGNGKGKGSGAAGGSGGNSIGGTGASGFFRIRY